MASLAVYISILILLCGTLAVNGCCCFTEDYQNTSSATPYPSLTVDEVKSVAKLVNYTGLIDTPIGGIVCFKARVDNIGPIFGSPGKYSITAAMDSDDPNEDPYLVNVLYKGKALKKGDSIMVWGRYTGVKLLPPYLAVTEVDAIYIERID